MIANQVAGLLAAATPPAPVGDFESIQTVTVGSGGSASVEFTLIPSTYKHLQIRAIGRFGTTGGYANDTSLTFNGATSGYSYHSLQGNGAAVSATAVASASNIRLPRMAGGTSPSEYKGAWVVDILDYANTNKYKTTRALGGIDGNGLGTPTAYIVSLYSGSYQSTSAITSIQIYPDSGSWTQYSHFALYGVK